MALHKRAVSLHDSPASRAGAMICAAGAALVGYGFHRGGFGPSRAVI
ncbi:hypothetical protein BN2475_600009 [Paraburkholderia ribeironis]|uniref:Uncharacterized protein n=1 Tax=Paraburkholderia ribeironis TaxID=1247936 RepID=A0A1N7SEW1_9BURK|nr:hypothetical protein BN2475_600009 [Paraburkholderia ribeironis]